MTVLVVTTWRKKQNTEIQKAMSSFVLAVGNLRMKNVKFALSSSVLSDVWEVYSYRERIKEVFTSSQVGSKHHWNEKGRKLLIPRLFRKGDGQGAPLSPWMLAQECASHTKKTTPIGDILEQISKI